MSQTETKRVGTTGMPFQDLLNITNSQPKVAKAKDRVISEATRDLATCLVADLTRLEQAHWKVSDWDLQNHQVELEDLNTGKKTWVQMS